MKITQIFTKNFQCTVKKSVFIFFIIMALPLINSPYTQAGGLKDKPEKGFMQLDEVRIGAFAHNAENDNPSEEGVDVNLEVLFGKPERRYNNAILDHILRPRPHIGGHINTNDDTSMLYVGLTWDYRLTDKLFIETSFGGALHNGPEDHATDLSFGCSANFRESASIGYQLDQNWSIMGTIDHMSNANLCDRNNGLTNIGGRIGYKFD